MIATACVSPDDSRVLLTTHGDIAVEDLEGGIGGSSFFGAPLDGGGSADVTARSADVELRFAASQFEVMVGREWSDQGVATDSYTSGLRWYPFVSDTSPGPFLEGVAKVESDENGGSSFVDGFEVRFGVRGRLWSAVELEVLAATCYFDSSKQEDGPRHETEFRVGIGLRFGLW